MLSIIICSIKENYFHAVSDSIKETIGTIPYEIIRIDNLKEQLSITKAYNKGAEQSLYPYLLFLHEDVAFLSSNWGEELINVLSKKEIGVVGLAGSKRKFKLPTGHYSGANNNYDFSFVRQRGYQNKDRENIQPNIEIKVLDGVFLACSKKVWEEYRFNESLPPFHFYDLDFSLRVSEEYRNYLVPSIVLEHFSMGNFDEKWIKASLAFHKEEYKFDIADESEIENIQSFWYERLKGEQISFITRMLFVKEMRWTMKNYKQAIKFVLYPYFIMLNKIIRK